MARISLFAGVPGKSIFGGMNGKRLMFVDTNIFLDFYRAEGETGLRLLGHIQSVSDQLIITDQVEMEFLKNRQAVILRACKELALPSIPPFVPAYLADSRTAASILQGVDEMRKRVRALKRRSERLLREPNRNDPVFMAFKKVCKGTALNLKCARPKKRTEIFDLALKRHLRGFPPRKQDASSIGDAINWEWILDRAKTFSTNVLIVSRDGDFGIPLDNRAVLNDWLALEFKERVSSKLNVELSRSLTQALKKLQVKVTPAEEREEKNIIERSTAPASSQQRVFPPFWPSVLERMENRNADASSKFREATEVLYGNRKLVICFRRWSRSFAPTVDNNENRAMIKAIFKELHLPDLKQIDMGGPPLLPEDDIWREVELELQGVMPRTLL